MDTDAFLALNPALLPGGFDVAGSAGRGQEVGDDARAIRGSREEIRIGDTNTWRERGQLGEGTAVEWQVDDSLADSDADTATTSEETEAN